jgi:CRISPR-associated endonuclease/helicase Cas3
MKAPKRQALELRSLPFEECIAKTEYTPNGYAPGATVAQHCIAVGLVARRLICRMNPGARDRLFPSGCDLLAALHDIGKVSPGFQEKIWRACGVDKGLGVGADYDKLAGYHGAVGQAALEPESAYAAAIVGRHHGESPAFIAQPDAPIYGGGAWRSEREAFRQYLQRIFGPALPEIQNDTMADAISGLVSVSDWIASGSEDRIADEAAADRSLDNAGFLEPNIRSGLSFRDIFGFEPNEMQRSTDEALSPHGIHIVEAPMGTGKTEAALYAAYRLITAGAARGIYFALPTRATSDRLQDRVEKFLDAILEPGSPHRHSHLLHGDAWLRETVMGEEGAPGGSWFDASKRGIIAPFCVGTIDQALMSVMNVRYGFVRAFGLAGKIVVLDEVHSYDCYTGTLLDALVQELSNLGATVIVLSATLTRGRRLELLGLDGVPDSREADLEREEPYPLISVRIPDGSCITKAVTPDPRSRVILHREPEDEKAISTAIEHARRGQQVLWIENTVGEAQHAYAILNARAVTLGLPCGLLHSRFTFLDRTRKETEWVSMYGKGGIPDRSKAGRILVGTQVLEQSLDIDADFLVSRLAPVDLLLQRIGRLWRHRENDALRRTLGATREAWILAPNANDFEADLTTGGKSIFVYSPYILCRSLEVLSDLECISLPDGIRGLIEATYQDREEKGTLGMLKWHLKAEREKLRRLARSGLGSGGKTVSDLSAPTRYAELESRDLLLIRSLHRSEGHYIVETNDGARLVLQEPAPTIRDRKYNAAALHRNMVRVPAARTPTTPRPSLGFLAPYAHIGREDESVLAVGIVNEAGYVVGLSGDPVAGPIASYDYCFGYRWKTGKGW